MSQNGQTVWLTYPPISGLASEPAILWSTLQPGQSWLTEDTWSGITHLGDETGTANGNFVVTNEGDPDGASASFQIQSSPLTYSLTVSPPAAAVRPPDGESAANLPVNLSYTITNVSDAPVTFNLPPADFIATASWARAGTVWESNPARRARP